MIWIIRKVGYTLLSRHFYVGIGVGFFLGSVSFSFAFTGSIDLLNSSSVTNDLSVIIFNQTSYFNNFGHYYQVHEKYNIFQSPNGFGFETVSVDGKNKIIKGYINEKLSYEKVLPLAYILPVPIK